MNAKESKIGTIFDIALRDAGIAYAIDQIVDLVTEDVAGIHLYTMNNANTAHSIHASISSLFTV